MVNINRFKNNMNKNSHTQGGRDKHSLQVSVDCVTTASVNPTAYTGNY